MMRLVIRWSHGDGCTYNCDETRPVQYESAEAFLVNFELAAVTARRARDSGFIFAGQEWSLDEFYENSIYYAPNVCTVDEWFENF